MNSKIGLEGVERNEGWAQEIQKAQSPRRGALKLFANAPPSGQFKIFVVLKELEIASLVPIDVTSVVKNERFLP